MFAFLKFFHKDPTYPLRVIRNNARDKYRYLVSKPNENPILILGNQKSGTSVITALLGKISNNTYSIDPFCRQTKLYGKLLGKDVEFKDFVNIARYEFSKSIIKEPGFTFCYDDIIKIFPQSKYVFVIRNPFDNIRSILDRVNIAGNKSDLTVKDLEKIKFHAPTWLPILKGDDIKMQGNTYIETLALRWKIASQVYINNKSKMILAKYELFQTNKINFIKDLANNLNLTSTGNISKDINIQFQPKGKNSNISIKEFFGQNNLKIIKNICDTEMKILDYLI